MFFYDALKHRLALDRRLCAVLAGVGDSLGFAGHPVL